MSFGSNIYFNKIGTDYGQIEFMDNFAEDELKKKLFNLNNDYLSVQKGKYLHELIEEFDNSYITSNAGHQEDDHSIVSTTPSMLCIGGA